MIIGFDALPYPPGGSVLPHGRGGGGAIVRGDRGATGGDPQQSYRQDLRQVRLAAVAEVVINRKCQTP